jgi:hypothetical protein
MTSLEYLNKAQNFFLAISTRISGAGGSIRIGTIILSQTLSFGDEIGDSVQGRSLGLEEFTMLPFSTFTGFIETFGVVCLLSLKHVLNNLVAPPATFRRWFNI